MVAVCGLTRILTSAAAVTISDALPEIEPEVAVIVVLPTATLVAKPALAAALLIVAIVPSDELQYAEAVRF